jgi:hypothetical protein
MHTIGSRATELPETLQGPRDKSEKTGTAITTLLGQIEVLSAQSFPSKMQKIAARARDLFQTCVSLFELTESTDAQLRFGVHMSAEHMSHAKLAENQTSSALGGTISLLEKMDRKNHRLIAALKISKSIQDKVSNPLIPTALISETVKSKVKELHVGEFLVMPADVCGSSSGHSMAMHKNC